MDYERVSDDAEDDNAAAMHQGLMFHRLDRQSNAVGITQADVEMDKTLLRLIQGCIRGDRLEAALSYASELNLQRSLQGALKLAVGSKKRNLGERISALLNNRESVVQAVNMEKENNANANNNNEPPSNRTTNAVTACTETCGTDATAQTPTTK